MSLLLHCKKELTQNNINYKVIWQHRFDAKFTSQLKSFKFHAKKHKDNFSNNSYWYIAQTGIVQAKHDHVMPAIELSKQQFIEKTLKATANYKIEFSLFHATTIYPIEICFTQEKKRSCSKPAIVLNKWSFISIAKKLLPNTKIRIEALTSKVLLANYRILRKQKNTVPNIIFIISDTTRRDAINPYNIKAVTPNLLKLSKQSTIFNNAYSNANWTRPSFTSIHTGRSNIELGLNTFRFNISQAEQQYFVKRALSFPAIVERKNIITAAIMDNIFALKYTGLGVEYGYSLYHNFASGKNQTQYSTQQAISFLKRNYDRSFFLTIHYNEPHFPYEARKKFLMRQPQKYSRYNKNIFYRKYMATISYVDQQIGQVLEMVKKLGIKKNTYIVFTADHGEKFDRNHKLVFNHQWYGPHTHGGTLNEEEIKVPLIVYNPFIKKKEIIKRPVQLKSLKKMFLAMLDNSFNLETWLKKENSLPFLIEGRMQYAWHYFNEKLIYNAPGYDKLITNLQVPLIDYKKLIADGIDYKEKEKQAMKSAVIQRSSFPYQYYNLITNAQELKVIAKPIKKSLIDYDKKFRAALPSFKINLPAAFSLSLTTKFGLLSYRSTCATIDFGNISIFRYTMNHFKIRNDTPKNCSISLSPYPLYSGFKQFIIYGKSKKVSIGPFDIVFSHWPFHPKKSFLQLLYSPVKDVTQSIFEQKNTSVKTNFNMKKLSFSGEENFNAELQSILKTWGYIQ